jgi:hypothetical protein
MRRFTTAVSDNGLFTVVYDHKRDITATIPNDSDAWKQIPLVMPWYIVMNLLRMGWFQRRKKLLP